MNRYCLPLFVALVMAHGAPSQKDWVAKLATKNAVEREIARRHLALEKKLPVEELVAQLADDDPDVVVAAASLLRSRGAATAELRKLKDHLHTAVRRLVLELGSDEELSQVLRDDKRGLRVAALHALEDRGRLLDDQLVAALESDDEALAEAAVRLIVFERSPFPGAIAGRVEANKSARLRLLDWLAARPRAGAKPWLTRVLGRDDITELERMLAIHALPPEEIDELHAKQVLFAAAGKDVAVSNRAGYAAVRFAPEIADKLVASVDGLVTRGAPIGPLLPCLERISRDGERQLLEFALRAAAETRTEVFHWLTMRESKLAESYVARVLDGSEPFPGELARLCGPALKAKGPRQAARIAAVASLLGKPGVVRIDAFEAMVEAEVYHPAMFEYTKPEASGRRLWRLLQLPSDRLPEKMFVDLFENSDVVKCTYASQSLARGPIPKRLEPTLQSFATESLHEPLQLAAARALMLWGSEVAGRKSWRAMQKGLHTDLGIRWLTEKPKPWSYEILLKERERLQKSTRKKDLPSLHRVLIALARLGDRGASQELLDAIPRLGPDEMRAVQDSRFLKQADLAKLAKKYLELRVGEATKDVAADADIDDERRVELLEWFVARKQVDLSSILEAMWKRDRSYEVRLIALRGLLAQPPAKLAAELLSELEKPYQEEAQQELAFEVVGSMSSPIPDKSMDLLAHIIVRAPLTDPIKEVKLALETGYDRVRGAYPILTPAANLLRRDETALPHRAFAATAAAIRTGRYAINRQRLGLFLVKISRRTELLDELGPVLSELILESPDRSLDFVAPAQMCAASVAETAGKFAEAARLYAASHRGFARGITPDHVRRAFLGTTDGLAGYHPMAALAARAPIATARASMERGADDAAKQALRRARDLAEGDDQTIQEITALQRTLEK